MIQSIKVTNHLGESIEMELSCPEKTGLLINDIDGLGPPTANINTTELSILDGAVFNSSRVGSRNIVISMILLPLVTIEDSRLRIYKFFPIKKKVTIEITTDRRSCITEGYVETVEPDIFSEQESCQVSVVCPDAYLYSIVPTVIYFTGIQSLFTFPFSNNSLTENQLVMGEINKVDTYTINYEGTVEIGITLIVSFTSAVKGLVIYDTKTRKILRIDDEILKVAIGSYFKKGDELTIVTQRGQRKATVFRDGRTINIINALKRPIGWLTLSAGNNQFSYAAEEGSNNIEFRIEYTTAYDGV